MQCFTKQVTDDSKNTYTPDTSLENYFRQAVVSFSNLWIILFQTNALARKATTFVFVLENPQLYSHHVPYTSWPSFITLCVEVYRD